MQAAFFDLDKTVIAKASMVAFGRPLYREGMLSRRVLARALYAQLVYLWLGADEARLLRMRDATLALTKGWTQAKVDTVVRATLDAVIEPIVYEEAVQRIRWHQEQGHKVFLVSASPQEIVAPLAQYIGVDEAIASRAQVDEDGRYTGQMELYVYGPAKADILRDIARRDGIDLAESWAYSDSVTDLPMLETVGYPIAVNPDRSLARAALERGWDIEVYVRRRPLREPRTSASLRITAGAGAAVLVAGAATGAWWWLREARNRISSEGTVSLSNTARLRNAVSLRDTASLKNAEWLRRLGVS